MVLTVVSACVAGPAVAASVPALPRDATEADLDTWLEAHIEPQGMVRAYSNTDMTELFDLFSVEKLANGNLSARFRAEFHRPLTFDGATTRSARWRGEVDCARNQYRNEGEERFSENNLKGRRTIQAEGEPWTTPDSEAEADQLRQICSLSAFLGTPDQARAMPTPPSTTESVSDWRARAVDAAGHVFLAERDGVSTYVAQKDIERRPDGKVHAWIRDELAYPVVLLSTVVRSARTEMEIDCTRRRYTLLDYVLHPGANLLGPGFDDFGSSRAEPFEPGAQRTRIMRALCRLADAPETSPGEALKQAEIPAPPSAEPDDVRAWMAAFIDTGLYAFSYNDDRSAYFYGTEDLYLLPNGNVTAFLRQERFTPGSEAEPVRSAIYKTEYDCRRNRTRTLASLYYGEANLEGAVYEGGTATWSRPYREGSYGRVNLDQICNLRSLLDGKTDLDLALPPPPASVDDFGVVAWLQGYIEPKGYAFGGFSDGAVMLYSTDEIERTAQGHIRVWTRTEMFEPTLAGVRSMRLLEEYDCEQGRSRLLAGELYPGANLLGDKVAEEAHEATWTYNNPGSLRSLVAARVCALEDGDGDGDDAISEPLLPGPESVTPL